MTGVKQTGVTINPQLALSRSFGQSLVLQLNHRTDIYRKSASHHDRYTKMKTATNIYIFNLALADSLFLATLPFQGTDLYLGFWPFGNTLCKVMVSIDYYNMFTSTFTLTVMSIDRYVAVCHPVKALDMRTPHKAKVVNICVWVLASAFGVPATFLGNVEEHENRHVSGTKKNLK